MDAEWCAVCDSDECRRTLACVVARLPDAKYWDGCASCPSCMRGIRSSKEPLVYVIPGWLKEADESNEELRYWMSGDPRNWLYADWTLDLGHREPLSTASCQKELGEIWVPAGYSLRWTEPRANSLAKA